MQNPFDISDNDCSSGDEITKIFESNIREMNNINDDVFDFEKWIIANKLSDLKECFNDHDMNTLDTLNLNNPNFTKLMADQRVLIKANLIQNIVGGIQSIRKKDESDEKEGLAEPETASTNNNNGKRTLIFMSPNENATFENMERYIEQLTNLRSELEVVTKQDFELTRDKNITQIEKYQTIHLNKLDGINHKIHSRFEDLHNKLNELTKKLETKLDLYKTEISEIKTSHEQLTSIINGKYKHSLSMINDDNKIYNCSIIKGKNIIKTYDSKEEKNNNNYSFKNINTKRENEICEIGNQMKNHYNKSMLLLNDDKKKMNKYINTNMNLPKKDVYYININHNIYEQIIADINKLIAVNATYQKQPKQSLPKPPSRQHNQPKKIAAENKDHGDDSIMDMINDINNIGVEISDEEEISFDNIYSVVFTNKPFGLTFGTNEHEKNLFVTTVDEKSLAFKLNVLIGSKVIKIQDDIVRDLGSSNIYKIFNNKFGKILPLKITFEQPKEIHNITFINDKNWFNNNIWELKNENKTIQHKGDHYEPYKSYAIYLGENNGYNKGVHFITVKCVKLKLNEAEGTVNCCIGVISEKNKDWILKGINESWPKGGGLSSSSYFDGMREDPYWYRNETIIVKLDINNLLVSYFTINDKSKKALIKKQKITKAKAFYFMMSVVSDPTVQFSIK